MAVNLRSLRLLSALLIVVAADPAPGRIPKVYNALITSNQNLEPSKAHPIYQPVLHDAVFSVQSPFLYGGHFPFASAGLFPLPIQPASGAQPSLPTPAPSTPEPAPAEPSTETPAAATEQASQSPEAPSESTTASSIPPNTESPIPLNEFGLPSQVLPLGRIDPAYSGFNHIGPLTYTYPSFPAYPGVRLYDPFDPFSLSPYSFPLYRPLPNVLGASSPFIPARFPVPAAPAPAPAAPAAGSQPSQTPPPEPSDLNVLNYSSKDPAIPNVPPPPLPQGGLKSDKNE